MVNLPPPLFFSESLDDIGTAFEGTGDGGRHPLVVRSGWARFAGAITALAARNAGDAERLVCVYLVYMYLFINAHSGPVLLVIKCHSHPPSARDRVVCMCVCT